MRIQFVIGIPSIPQRGKPNLAQRFIAGEGYGYNLVLEGRLNTILGHFHLSGILPGSRNTVPFVSAFHKLKKQ